MSTIENVVSPDEIQELPHCSVCGAWVGGESDRECFTWVPRIDGIPRLVCSDPERCRAWGACTVADEASVYRWNEAVNAPPGTLQEQAAWVRYRRAMKLRKKAIDELRTVNRRKARTA